MKKLLILLTLCLTTTLFPQADKGTYQSRYYGTPEFPRIASYHFGGGSIDWLGQFSIVSSKAVDSINLALVKLKYPNTILLASSDWNEGEPLVMVAADSLNVAWRVRDTLGWYQTVETGPAMYLYDMSDLCSTLAGRKYGDTLAIKLSAYINWDTFDGLISEGSWRQPLSTNGCDLDRNGLNDYAEVGKGSAWVASHWAAGYHNFIDSLRVKITARIGANTKLILYNSVTDTMLMTAINGTMIENVLDHTPVLVNWVALLKQWDADQTVLPKYHLLASGGRYDSANAPDPNYKDYYRYVRFTLGMTLMTDAFFMFNDIGNHNYRFYYDEYDADLGYPTGPSDTLANGVWYRFYQNGAVIANPTSTSRNVFVADISGLTGYDGPYYHPRGAQDALWNSGALYDSVTLASTAKSGYGGSYGNVGDAVILTKIRDTAIADIIIDNAYAGTTPGHATMTFTAGFIVDTTSDLTAANPTWNVGPQQGYTGALTPRPHRAHVGSGAHDTTATATPTITVAGYYNVYERHGWSGSSPSNRPEANDVPHIITYDGGVDTIRVDQETGVARWNLLGQYYFATGTAGRVLISNSCGVWVGAPPSGEWVIADAIKFEYVGPSP